MNAKRIAENLGIFEFDAEDTASLDAIDLNLRYNDASTDFGYVFCKKKLNRRFVYANLPLIVSDEKSAAKIAEQSLENLVKLAASKVKGAVGA